MGDSSGPITKTVGNDMIEKHVTIPKPLYERVIVYQKDLVGEPSVSGIIVTALRQLLDNNGYLGDA